MSLVHDAHVQALPKPCSIRMVPALGMGGEEEAEAADTVVAGAVAGAGAGADGADADADPEVECTDFSCALLLLLLGASTVFSSLGAGEGLLAGWNGGVVALAAPFSLALPLAPAPLLLLLLLLLLSVIVTGRLSVPSHMPHLAALPALM
jgi:hypothetical protein